MDPFYIPARDISEAKQRIWSRLESRLYDAELQPYQAVLDAMAHISNTEGAEPDRLKRAVLKERLLDRLPEQPSLRRYALWRPLFAGSALLAMLTLLVGPFLGSPVMAQPTHTLWVESGIVMINGEVLRVNELRELKVGDQIVTSEDSRAHLRLADDSRMTLGASTSLSLKQSLSQPAQSDVVFEQTQGRIWVQSLVSENSSLSLDLPGGRVSSQQPSTFDVQIGDDLASEVTVLKNLVSVETEKSQEWLPAGQKVALGENHTVAILDAPDFDETWVKYNESYGEDYLNELEIHEEKESAVLASQVEVSTPEISKTVSKEMSPQGSGALYWASDALDKGLLNEALTHVHVYQRQSQARFDELAVLLVPEREALLPDFISKKEVDFLMLKLLSQSPELANLFDFQAQILKERNQLNLLVQQRSMQVYEVFFDGETSQEEQELLQDYIGTHSDLHHEDLSSVILIDPRFSKEESLDVSHSDEPQNESNGSKEGANDPETHDDL